jgi:hypothetical protein
LVADKRGAENNVGLLQGALSDEPERDLVGADK